MYLGSLLDPSKRVVDADDDLLFPPLPLVLGPSLLSGPVVEMPGSPGVWVVFADKPVLIVIIVSGGIDAIFWLGGIDSISARYGRHHLYQIASGIIDIPRHGELIRILVIEHPRFLHNLPKSVFPFQRLISIFVDGMGIGINRIVLVTGISQSSPSGQSRKTQVVHSGEILFP